MSIVVNRFQIAFTLALCLLLVACAPFIFDDSEAGLVLEDMVSGSGPSRLKERTEPPTRERLQYVIQERRYYGDLYHPANEPTAGIVLIPGVAPGGNDDPRLVALATTLARVRFLVLVPDVPGFREYKVRSTAVQTVEDAFILLRDREELTPQQHIGIGAISYAVGPALIAALRPKIREQVQFLVGVGGYYDLHRVISFFTTGQLESGGRWRGPAPHAYGKWVFALSNADLLDDLTDRSAMQAFAHDQMYSSDAYPKPRSPDFSPGGQALYDLIVNTDPARVTPLIRRLPDTIRTELTALNPAEHDLSRLKARLILLHGREDNIIPYVESLDLFESVPAGQAELFIIDGLAHVDLRPKVFDLPQLHEMVAALLAHRRPARLSHD